MPTYPTSGRRGRTEEFLKSLVTMSLPYSQPRSYYRFLELPFSGQLCLTGCFQVNQPRRHWLAGLCDSGLEYPARFPPALQELPLLSGSGFRLSMRESGRDGKKRQGRAEVVEPLLAVSAVPQAPARPPAAALRPERRELQSESASSSWGQQCHSVQGSEGQTRVPACPPGRWSVPTCPFMPPESSFRPDTKCRGRAWHRLLLQLPPLTALFSATKPYITHAGPASLARSWLFRHQRT